MIRSAFARKGIKCLLCGDWTRFCQEYGEVHYIEDCGPHKGDELELGQVSCRGDGVGMTQPREIQEVKAAELGNELPG